MATSKGGALTRLEKRVVKGLLALGWRNQDIQALINIGRPATINSARVTEVKKNERQIEASEEEIEYFKLRQSSYDLRTGLNLYDHERLVRAREAILLAVQVFNSPVLNFKTEVFSVLANIGWTYLLHEFYARKGVAIVGKDGHSLLLSQMIERADCPLSDGMKNNIRAIKKIRDEVEHKLLGYGDLRWLGLYQACCLNFDKAICEIFDPRLSLQNELSIALQFAKIGMEQLTIAQKFGVPEHIEALDARLAEGLTEEQISNLEYQFRVIYTLDAASKGRANIEFVRPESTEGRDIRNILVSYKTADHLYPYKPRAVCHLVSAKTGRTFTQHDHTQAWKRFEVRPAKKAKQPENTNKEFCIFHPAHKDYTYSEKWVERLVGEIANED